MDAFTDQAFGGNPAGVVPEAAILEEEEMQLAAREFNLSETAFLSPSGSENADFRVRYFTPSCEIDFCGHATLSAAWIMASELDWLRHSREIRFETNIGIVPGYLPNRGRKACFCRDDSNITENKRNRIQSGRAVPNDRRFFCRH